MRTAFKRSTLLVIMVFMVASVLSGCSNASESDSTRIPYSQTIAHKKDYQEVISKIEAAGFTNVKTEPIYDLVTGFLTKDGSVEEIRVGGTADYSPDKKYPKDIEIVVVYHTFPSNKDASEEESVVLTTELSGSPTSAESESSVYYSTNDSETAKQGNSGVYAYCGDVNPDQYYIIDFEEGFVYCFLDDESGSCDRIKIDSGNLNDVLIFTYHDGDSSWSNSLHFKWKNQPTHLILQDDDGFEWDFYPTNLESALKIRDEKKIIDY